MPADRAEDRLPNLNRSLLDIIAEEGRRRADQGDGPRRPGNPAATPARLADQVEAILRGQGQRLPRDPGGMTGEASDRSRVMEIDEGDPVDIRKFALAVSLLGDMARRILAASDLPPPLHSERLPRQPGPEDRDIAGIDRRLDRLAAGLEEMAADIAALRRDFLLPPGRNPVAPLGDRGQAAGFSAALGDLKALRDQLQSVSLDRSRPLR